MLSGDPIILSNDVIIFVPQRERERERMSWKLFIT